MNKRTQESIELIFCSFDPVGLNDYVHYFAKTFSHFIYQRWKFPHSRSTVTSALITFRNGKKTNEKIIPSPYVFTNKFLYFLFLPLNYFYYFIQTVITLWSKNTDKTRVFIGVNFFCTFCGLILKYCRRVDLVIYRVTDFFPLPPKGIYRIINRIFYVIDKFCINHADDLWFTTMGHIEGREKYGYFERKKYAYKLIPLGMNPDKYVSVRAGKIDKNSLVYCGVISRYHLLDILFTVIEILSKNNPVLKLHIVGSGPDEKYFKDLARQMQIEDHMVFHGYLKEGKKLTEIISKSLAGIALYKDVEDFMKYTEPAKVKYYLSFGIPAIVSRVPHIARELHEQKVSFAVRNDPDEIAQVIKKLAQNEKLLQTYKYNIKVLVKKIDIRIMLSKLIEDFIKNHRLISK